MAIWRVHRKTFYEKARNGKTRKISRTEILRTFRAGKAVFVAQDESGNGVEPETERPPVPASLDEAERSIREQRFETAHVFDRDGSYRFGRNGEESKVTFSDDEIPLIKDSIFIHNHPGGKTFSRADIRFVEDLNPFEFRVVTRSKRYILRRQADTWPRQFYASYLAAFSIVGGRLSRELKHGKIDQAAFNSRLYLDTMKRFAKEKSLDYREEDF